MAITRLKRKGRKNKLTSKRRIQKLALESSQPVIKNVDVDAIKAQFEAAAAKPAKAEKKETAPKTNTPAKKAEKKEATPKAEKKAPANPSAKASESPKKKKAPAKKKED